MSYALAPDPGTGSSIKTPLRRSQRLIAQLSARYEPEAITCSQSLPTHTCSDPDRPFRQAPLLSQASRPHPYDLNKDGDRAVGGGLFHITKGVSTEVYTVSHKKPGHFIFSYISVGILTIFIVFVSFERKIKSLRFTYLLTR